MSSFNDESAKSSRGEGREVNKSKENLEKLKSLRSKVNWEIEEERLEFLRQLHDLTSDWKGQLPNLRDIFTKGEMDWLLIESVTHRDSIKIPFFEFVIRSGYKDKPELDKDGKPFLRCTTAMHHVARSCLLWLVYDLLQIYDVDVNYTDEDGLTHFHVACMYGCEDVVKKFLQLGQDPNCILQKTGETPLHIALENNNFKVARSLLKGGANPNLTNEKGSNCLHVICKRAYVDYHAMMLFKICYDEHKTLQVDVRDDEGNAPLHSALGKSWKLATLILLRMGADPNLTNERGSTPLHIICRRKWTDEFDCDDNLNVEEECDNNDRDLMVLFFKILDKTNQLVLIDAQDQKGRTPLQIAVANCVPPTVDILLEYGADLSAFVFPTTSHFVETWKPLMDKMSIHPKLKLASSLLLIVERLEEKGYELKLSDVRTIMTVLDECGCLKKSADLHKWWYCRSCFQEAAKEATMNSKVTLYDFIQSRPEKATTLLTYEEYLEFARRDNYCRYPDNECYEFCSEYLCEVMLRGFFRSWALLPIQEKLLTRLPILCCDAIVELLVNKDYLTLFLTYYFE